MEKSTDIHKINGGLQAKIIMEGKMTGYDIYSDVSLDMAFDLAEKYDIKYVPMDVMLNGKITTSKGLMGFDEMHTYYEELRHGAMTGTSQISQAVYEDIFTTCVKEGRSLMYLALSSGLSSTYDSACLVLSEIKEEYGEDNVHIEVIDTLGATGGMGMLAELAGINRDAGMDLKENAEYIREYTHRIHYWFMVEDLMFLKRGGRVSGASAVIGTALNIKPVLEINSIGKLDTVAKKRGLKLAMKELADLFMSNRGDPLFEKTLNEKHREELDRLKNRVYMCSSDRMADLEILKEMILKLRPESDIRITPLGPVIGAHTGPDMIAVINFGNVR